MPSRIVRGRRVLLPGGMRPAAIHIENERITAITPHDAPVTTNVPTFDAGSMVVMPGLVDTHVHINEPGRTDWEGFETATRAAAAALGLQLLAPEDPSPAATGIYMPDGIDADQVLDFLREKMNVTLAEGQDQLKGKVIRIAHIGYMGAFDVITAVAALEMGLRKFGVEIPFGRGVAAAQEVLLEALA